MVLTAKIAERSKREREEGERLGGVCEFAKGWLLAGRAGLVLSADCADFWESGSEIFTNQILAGGAEAAGDGVYGEEELGEHGFGFLGAVFLAGGAPAAEEVDLIEVEEAEGVGTELQCPEHARAALSGGLAAKLLEHGAGAGPFLPNQVEDAGADFLVFDEAGVAAHEVEIGAGDGGFDVGQDVVEEGR